MSQENDVKIKELEAQRERLYSGISGAVMKINTELKQLYKLKFKEAFVKEISALPQKCLDQRIVRWFTRFQRDFSYYKEGRYSAFLDSEDVTQLEVYFENRKIIQDNRRLNLVLSAMACLIAILKVPPPSAPKPNSPV